MDGFYIRWFFVLNSNKKIPNSNSERNWNLEFNFWNLIYLIDQFTWRETKLLFETSAEI